MMSLRTLNVMAAAMVALGSVTTADAELINDTYTVRAIGFDNSDLTKADFFTGGYLGTFDGTAEQIGANPFGESGDLLWLSETLNTSQTGNTVTSLISVTMFSTNSDQSALKPLFGSNSDTLIGGTADSLFFDIGFANDPATGLPNPLSATIPAGINYTLLGGQGEFLAANGDQIFFTIDGAGPLIADTTAPEIAASVRFVSDVSLSINALQGLNDLGAAPVAVTQTFLYSATVPEPSSFAALSLLGVGGIIYRRRRVRTAG